MTREERRRAALQQVVECLQEAKSLPALSQKDVGNLIRQMTTGDHAHLQEYMLRKAWIESRFNPLAMNKASGAAGLYQIMWFNLEKEWQENEDFNPFHASHNIEWTLDFTENNADYLRSKGIRITDGRLYLAHQQGAGGALKILTAANQRLPISSLDDTTERNVRANIPARTRITTCVEFVQLWESKMANAQIHDLPNRLAMNEDDDDVPNFDMA